MLETLLVFFSNILYQFYNILIVVTSSHNPLTVQLQQR